MLKNQSFLANFFAFSTYSQSSIAIESTLLSYPALLSKPDSPEEYKGFLRVESLDCYSSSNYSFIDQFFVGWVLKEENFMKELTVPIPPELLPILPIDIPLILFDPDSQGTIFLDYFYYENAFLALNYFSASAFLSTFFIPNLSTISAMKSDAPYGFFSSYFFDFFPLPFPFCYFSAYYFSFCFFYYYIFLSLYFSASSCFLFSSYCLFFSYYCLFFSSYCLFFSSYFIFLGSGTSYFWLVGFVYFYGAFLVSYFLFISSLTFAFFFLGSSLLSFLLV